MLNRVEPDLDPSLVLTQMETKILDHSVSGNEHDPPLPKTLSLYLIKIARLGGYLARANDPQPGNLIMSRGMPRLTDINLGANLRDRLRKGVPIGAVW